MTTETTSGRGHCQMGLWTDREGNVIEHLYKTWTR